MLIEAFASSVTLLSAPLCRAEGLSLHYVVLLLFLPPPSTSEMSQGNEHKALTWMRTDK